MKLDRIRKLEDGKYEIPFYYLPTEYFDAFNILHRFENTLRIFVYSILKASLGGNWANTVMRDASKDKEDQKAGQDTIHTVSKKIRNQLDTYGHIGILPLIPLLYLTMDDLVATIACKSNAKYFSSTFPASIEKVYEPKLKELVIIRNTLMHFRKINAEDIERLFFNIEDLMHPISDYLDDLVDLEISDEYIPTQDDRWHSLWTSMITKRWRFSRVRLTYSKKRRWLKVNLHFKGVYIASERKYYNIDFSKTNKDLSSLLPQIIFYGNWSIGKWLVINKDETVSAGDQIITLCFSGRTFDEHHEDILAKVAYLIDEIENEYEKVSSQDDFVTKLAHLKVYDIPRESSWLEEHEDGCRYLEERIPQEDIPEDWSPEVYDTGFHEILMNSPWVH
jgi:hypothetical protein